MADAKTWAKRVAAWCASGLTCREFAEREGLGAWRTLRYWAWRLDRERRKAKPKLVRVVREPRPVVVPEPAAAEVVELEVRFRGARIAMRAELEEQALATVLEVLGTALQTAVRRSA